MKIIIGCDHIAYDLKKEIVEYLKNLDYEVIDIGTYSTNRVDYPIYAHEVANRVASGEFKQGILICGTGVGVSIVANKTKGIRAVVCSEAYTAILSKQHNNSNILAFGSRVVGVEVAKMIVREWLNAQFEEGRHLHRIRMIE